MAGTANQDREDQGAEILQSHDSNYASYESETSICKISHPPPPVCVKVFLQYVAAILQYVAFPQSVASVTREWWMTRDFAA